MRHLILLSILTISTAASAQQMIGFREEIRSGRVLDYEKQDGALIFLEDTKDSHLIYKMVDARVVDTLEVSNDMRGFFKDKSQGVFVLNADSAFRITLSTLELVQGIRRDELDWPYESNEGLLYRPAQPKAQAVKRYGYPQELIASNKIQERQTITFDSTGVINDQYPLTYREPRTQSAYSTSLSDVQSTPTQVLGGRRSVVAPVAEMKEYSWPTRKVNIDFHAGTLVVMEKENGTWTTSEMIMERPMMWQGGSGDAIYDQASEEIYVRYISQGGYNWYKLNESNGKISRVGRKSGLSDGLQWKIHDGCLFYRDINSKRYSGKIDLE